MADKNEKKYNSKFSELKIDSANFLAELVCLRKAEKENNGRPPERFWNLPKYKSYYIQQVTQANLLLKKYDLVRIVDALNSSRGHWIYSLTTKQLIPIIEETRVKIIEVIPTEVKQVQHQKPIPSKILKGL